MPKPKPEKTIEEEIREEAYELAACMGKKGIETEFGPLSEITAIQQLFSAARHQNRAHAAFGKLADLFAQWGAKHPR